MRRIFPIAALFAFLASAGFFAGPVHAAETLVTIGAAPLGGTYYPAALALADIIQKHVPEIEARVEVTGGTMENPVLMQQGELQLGLANADVALFAYKGLAPFQTPFTDIRTMFSGLAPGVVHYVTLKDSGICSINDLAGKRVAVGPQGNSSGLLFEKVLDFYGVKATGVTRSFVSFSDGVSELLDGHVDMAVIQAGLPAPGLQEAFAGGKKLVIISFPEKERDAFLEKHPYYSPATIPEGTYVGMNSNVTTFATHNLVLVHASLPEKTVYGITKAIFDHLPDLYAAHPSLRSVTLQTATNSPIPLHEGALRYFRDVSACTEK